MMAATMPTNDGAPGQGRSIGANQSSSTANPTCIDANNQRPIEPKPGTHKAAFLTELQGGRRLTAGQCWLTIGSSRAAALAHALRKDGWPIQSRLIEVETVRGKTAHVAEYFIAEGSRDVD